MALCGASLTFPGDRCRSPLRKAAKGVESVNANRQRAGVRRFNSSVQFTTMTRVVVVSED
jgi:hypothetical protein